MRQLLWCLVAAVLVLGSAASVATAGREPVVRELVTLEATPVELGTFGALADCQVGNVNPAAWAINDFLFPPEAYKLTFDPTATCTVCPMGFNVTTVRVFLQTAGACQVVLSADVEEAVYQTPNCPSPGPVVCASPLYAVNLPSAGLWNVGVPITCDCLPPGQKYLLSVHFESATCTPALITDAGPALACTNWNNYGTGWYDLLGAFPTWPGQLKIFADAECCSPPVPAEGKNWGAIKELYED
jgi:hypothetical protein